MTQSKYLLLLLLLSSACQKQQLEISNDLRPAEIQIAKDLIQGVFDDIWSARDSTKLLDYHTKDFVILENGEVWDNTRIKKFMRDQMSRQNRPDRINKMDYISVDKYGESIQLAYQNHADFIRNDSLLFEGNWLESALAVKTEKGWRLKMMHSTWVNKE